MKTAKPKKIKQKSLSKLKKELDTVFSWYIRKRDDYICFTCQKQLDRASSQNGHYITRGNLALRFDEINCHCQCVGCNIFKKGNYPVYSIKLIEKYGVDILQRLAEVSRLPVKYSKIMYQAKIDYYKKLLK